MGGYFNRGASAGGHDHGGYHDREGITGPAGVGSATGGPGGVGSTNDEEFTEPGPEIAQKEPGQGDVRLDETAGVDSPVRADESYERIIEESSGQEL